jgi:hypothetical protein
MPTFWGLGLTESCRMTRDIGYQIDMERDIPRSGALDGVKPLLPACLILIIEINELQWGSRRLGLRSRREANISNDLALLAVNLDVVIVCPSADPLLALIL